MPIRKSVENPARSASVCSNPIFLACIFPHSLFYSISERFHDKNLRCNKRNIELFPRRDERSSVGESPNQGKLIVETSCTPVDIRCPMDLSLLNEVREKRRVKPTELRKAIGKQLRYVKRDLQHIETLAEWSCLEVLSLMEIRLTFRDGRYKLIEVNPRVGVWHTLAIGAGIDLPYILYQDVIGEKTEIQQPLNELKWVRLITDVPTVFKEIISGRMKISDYLASMKGKKVFAVLSLSDPLPFFAEVFMLPYLWIKRGF